jgi:ubiquitin-like protein ATG12
VRAAHFTVCTSTSTQKDQSCHRILNCHLSFILSFNLLCFILLIPFFILNILMDVDMENVSTPTTPTPIPTTGSDEPNYTPGQESITADPHQQISDTETEQQEVSSDHHQSNSSLSPTTSNHKLKIHFVPVGNAPIMKRTKFLVTPTETFASLQTRLRKLLQQESTPSLFMYLHTCFVPSLEDTVGQLFDLYHTSQELKVHYSLQEAWG